MALAVSSSVEYRHVHVRLSPSATHSKASTCHTVIAAHNGHDRCTTVGDHTNTNARTLLGMRMYTTRDHDLAFDRIRWKQPWLSACRTRRFLRLHVTRYDELASFLAGGQEGHVLDPLNVSTAWQTCSKSDRNLRRLPGGVLRGFGYQTRDSVENGPDSDCRVSCLTKWFVS